MPSPDSVIYLVTPLIKLCLVLYVVLIVGIRKRPSPLLHHGNKSWVAHQLHNDLCYNTDQQFFVVLPLEITFVSVHHRAMLATIVVKILGF